MASNTHTSSFFCRHHKALIDSVKVQSIWNTGSHNYIHTVSPTTQTVSTSESDGCPTACIAARRVHQDPNYTLSSASSDLISNPLLWTKKEVTYNMIRQNVRPKSGNPLFRKKIDKFLKRNLTKNYRSWKMVEPFQRSQVSFLVLPKKEPKWTKYSIIIKTCSIPLQSQHLTNPCYPISPRASYRLPHTSHHIA